MHSAQWIFILQTTNLTVPTAPSTLHTVYCTLHTAHCKMKTAHCTLHTEHWTLKIAHCTLKTANCTLYALHCTLYTAHCTAHCTLNIAHRKLRTAQCTLTTEHCTLQTANCKLRAHYGLRWLKSTSQKWGPVSRWDPLMASYVTPTNEFNALKSSLKNTNLKQIGKSQFQNGLSRTFIYMNNCLQFCPAHCALHIATPISAP